MTVLPDPAPRSSRAPLVKRDDLRALLVLGLPLVGVQLAQFGVKLLDTIMLGWYDVTALAASVVGGGLAFVFLITLFGFGFALMPIVAAAEARGDEVVIRRATRMAIWLSVGCGLAVLPIMWQGGAILRALGQKPEVAALAQDYLRIFAFGVIPALVIAVLKSYLAALEKTAVSLWLTVGALVANGLMNYALIFGNWGAPEMGVQGAALASVIAQTVSMLLLAIYAGRVRPEHQLWVRFWRPDWHEMGLVFKLGWPIGLTSVAEVGLFTAASILVGWIGVIELAAHGIALDIAAACFMLHIGLAQAATVRAGAAFGRDDAEGLKRVARAALLLAGAVAVLVIVLFLGVGEHLVSVFLSRDDPQYGAVLATGTVLLGMAALFQLGDALQVTAVNLLRGMQDTRVPMAFAIFSYWGVGLSASYVFGFPLGLGAVGVWLGLAVGLLVAGVFLMHRFWVIQVPKVGVIR
ncbi:Multidrug resistance protein MdtK [Aquimixticola soesokkakensis]|uniref:Multidrug-efflux transporter n=1 Tax=Aquimixticola soesokkakensis TaxID=1519096 RepID=A0A1Y5SVR6_9RHOB|nr:MATE family efflux transporter [Aquimixticola soesokkakensis]SLN49731.1 Multidrug resistance protein MdtK [Aquimixticola soesokkakensis]